MAETYFGKVCAKHPELNGERYVNRKRCLACVKARWKEWRDANLEKVKAAHKARRDANLEKERARCKAWRDANPEKVKAVYKAYGQSPKGKLADLVKSAKRRARKRQQAVPLTEHEEYRMKQIYEIARINGWHVDHIKPLAKGGLHHPDNLQWLKPEVNRRKGDKEIHPLFLWQLEDQT